MKMHSLVDPPRRDGFNYFEDYLNSNPDLRRNYVTLCHWFGAKKHRGHLYEFCAMNGHLAAFEEVFKEDTA